MTKAKKEITKETATATYLRDKGFHVLIEPDKKVTLTGRLGSVLDCLQDRDKFSPVEENCKKRIADFYSDHNKNWTGGSAKNLLDDLSGKIDMVPFEEAREKFEKSDIAKRLRERFEKCQPRRQRVKSEYDGEFNESRRWDIAPFDGVTKAPGYGRSIEVLIYGAVSASTSAEELNAYGNMAWALIEVIERAGVNVRVGTRYKLGGFVEGRNGDLTIDVESKKAGEYLSPSLLAATLKSNFFRRAVFQQICLAADAIGETASYGLGVPHQPDSQIEFKDGQLIISPRIRNAGFEEIERELLKAIA